MQKKINKRGLRYSSFGALVAHIAFSIHYPRHQPHRARHRSRHRKSQARNEQVGEKRRIVLAEIGVGALRAIKLKGGWVLFGLLGSGISVWIADTLFIVSLF